MIVTVLLAALTAVVIFGASPVAAKIAVTHVPALEVAVLRTVLGGLIAIPVARLLRIGLPASTPQRGLLLLSGFCGFVAFPLIFTFGVRATSATHAAMILAVLPVFTGAIAMAWELRRPSPLWWAGCLVATVGEAILIFGSGPVSAGASLEGDLLVLLANVFASLGYVAGGRLQRSGYSARGTTFWGVAIFAIALLPLAPFVLDGHALVEVDLEAWLAIGYLAIGVTIVGYILWYWALGSGGIARIGLLQFLQPVSGVLLAWLLLGEAVSGTFLLASMVILAGVWFAFQAK